MANKNAKNIMFVPVEGVVDVPKPKLVLAAGAPNEAADVLPPNKLLLAGAGAPNALLIERQLRHMLWLETKDVGSRQTFLTWRSRAGGACKSYIKGERGCLVKECFLLAFNNCTTSCMLVTQYMQQRIQASTLFMQQPADGAALSFLTSKSWWRRGRA
jgi:hypothetical protein